MNASMNRRDLLLGGAALAASAALPSSLFAAGMKKSPIRLGIASYTFRQFKPDQVIGFMKQLNCTYLNLKDVHLPMAPLSDVPALAKHYRDAGLELTDAGTIYFKVDTDEDVRPKFDYLKAAGIKSFVGSPTHEALPRVEKFIKEYDVRMAMHNHGPEDKEWPSPYDIEKVIRPMDHRIGWCIDVGHTMRTNTDPVEAIKMAGDRLYDVHMKDLANPSSRESQVAVGEGKMPVKEIFQALIGIKYKYFVDLEYEIHGDDPMPGVLKSFASMRKTLAEMGYSA
jgi:sugar phosphate isomerase/epimerase